MSSPSVTVLVCTNKIDYQFYDSVKSVCCQDYNNLKISIFLDGIYNSCHHRSISKILKSYDRQYVITGSSSSVGLTKGLLQLQENTSTEYFARIDIGDLWQSNKITKQIEACLRYSYTVVGTRSQYIDQYGTILGLSELLPYESESIIQRIKCYKGLYDHSSILFSSAFKYDSNWYYSQDMKLYVDIANHNKKFGYIPDPLTLVRFNPNGITIQKRPLQIYYEKEARRRLNVRSNKFSLPKHVSKLHKPNKYFSYFYKNFINSIQSKNYLTGYFFLLLSCISDLRVLGYYLDRIIYALYKLLQ